MLYLDYNEKQIHGTNDFPIAFYHVDSSHPRYEMPFHWHKEYEIIRIRKGILYLTLNEEKISAQSGESILIPSGSIHGAIPENCIYECLVFNPDLLYIHADSCRQYIKKIKHQDILVHSLITPTMTTLHSTIERLFLTIKTKPEGYELLIAGTLLELFGLIFCEKFYSNKTSGTHSPFYHLEQLKSVFEYIENHYSSDITLNQLSQICGMSPKYFCRYFQTIVHKTPMDYLNYYRIERACSLLCTTDASITSIAYDCGFNDNSYFIKVFKRYKHTTPKQYQLQMKRG